MYLAQLYAYDITYFTLTYCDLVMTWWILVILVSINGLLLSCHQDNIHTNSDLLVVPTF